MNETSPAERSNRTDREQHDDDRRRPPTGEVISRRSTAAGRLTGTPTGSATSSVTTTTSTRKQRLSFDNNIDDDDDVFEEDGGYVTTSSSSRRHRRPTTTSSTTPSSSWAQQNRGRLRSPQSILRYPDASQLPQPPPSVLPDDGILDDDDTQSFKAWLTGSMLGALSTAAGITLSATNTIATPAVGMTQNVILPSILTLIVDTLDTTTPTFIKDWFRIISSSVYHLYSVLASTNQGKILRQQLLVVIQSSLEAWSAPESRQVVVDGMAAGVKLADALHTPEMFAFLEQTSVLGCRVVDAVSSGKAKQLIHNSKDLVWNGIELAVDPATTIALAEVTAHLCHALEETADSVSSSSSSSPQRRRTTRDGQNKGTYLQPNQVTDYQAEPIEAVILSSLGVAETVDTDTGIDGGRPPRQPEDNNDDDDDDTTAVQSIPSNADVFGDNSKSNKDQQQQDTLWRSREESVNVHILRDRIQHEGRPKARPSMKLSGDHPRPDTNSTSIQSQNDDELQRRLVLDVEEVPEIDRGGVDYHTTPLQSNATNNTTYIREVNGKLEEYASVHLDDGAKESSGGAARFYQLVDEYTKLDRLKKEEQNQTEPGDDISQSAEYTTGFDDQSRMQLLKAKVSKMKEGKEQQQRERSRKAKEDYFNLRRKSSKYPPFKINFSTALLVGSLIMFWTALGLYGMYTLAHVAYFRVVSPRNLLLRPSASQPAVDPVPPLTNSNEMVIRIVREVVHVREDGSSIDGPFASPDASFSKQEMDSVMECVAAMEEKSTKKKAK